MVIAWITHQRRYQRQAKFIGSVIVSILVANMLPPRSHIGESVVSGEVVLIVVLVG
ncbi:MAG: hypothetical protein HWQ38_16640 [Nostoc sp. NMS7]|uniref:hypothetical protein n=1 Tax=Nostoc sp. NMS7 TaxID=2815391 RepID=UPI0025CFF9E3|nr:hypothetical protein [Nostoc sp. NMS7]MBN3947992.1 hypothetical protein [Nostoc sp. NMS7]